MLYYLRKRCGIGEVQKCMPGIIFFHCFLQRCRISRRFIVIVYGCAQLFADAVSKRVGIFYREIDYLKFDFDEFRKFIGAKFYPPFRKGAVQKLFIANKKRCRFVARVIDHHCKVRYC